MHQGSAAEQLFDRERGGLGSGSGFPAFSIGTAQDVSFFLIGKKKKRFLGNAR